MTKSKNLREHLTIEQKNEIITFHEVNQELSLQKICQICDILKTQNAII